MLKIKKGNTLMKSLGLVCIIVSPIIVAYLYEDPMKNYVSPSDWDKDRQIETTEFHGYFKTTKLGGSTLVTTDGVTYSEVLNGDDNTVVVNTPVPLEPNTLYEVFGTRSELLYSSSVVRGKVFEGTVTINPNASVIGIEQISTKDGVIDVKTVSSSLGVTVPYPMTTLEEYKKASLETYTSNYDDRSHSRDVVPLGLLVFSVLLGCFLERNRRVHI